MPLARMKLRAEVYIGCANSGAFRQQLVFAILDLIDLLSILLGTSGPHSRQTSHVVPLLFLRRRSAGSSVSPVILLGPVECPNDTPRPIG